MEIQPIFLLSLLVYGVTCGNHSLTYYATTLLNPIPGLPVFTAVVSFNDLRIVNYNSDTQHPQPLYKWWESLQNPEEWKEETKFGQHYESILKYLGKAIQTLFNETYHEDVSIYQVKFTCSLHEDGSTGDYDVHGIDGNDLLVYDKEKSTYTPLMQKAQTIIKWFEHVKVHPRTYRQSIEQKCLFLLKKGFNNRKKELEKKVPPQVKVSESPSDKITKLHCFVFGFYPQAVDVKWVKNNTFEVYSEDVKQVLPNPDETYQLRVSVKVLPEDRYNYSCHVDHSSLNKTIIIQLEPKGSNTVSILIGILVAVVILVIIAVVGIYRYRNAGQHHRVNIREQE
ncbi:zinc-alpha-2-glycoprotein [Bombina bombina]|uniref:zinc-alpha-2-glycoprotein n=1 Tax=Bombina bombina TaxID=8345 RepID=UPI00235A58ED|nr:zinc-alpha-2-glycoprotein [Bombina bombina]